MLFKINKLLLVFFSNELSNRFMMIHDFNFNFTILFLSQCDIFVNGVLQLNILVSIKQSISIEILLL